MIIITRPGLFVACSKFFFFITNFAPCKLIFYQPLYMFLPMLMKGIIIECSSRIK